MALAKTATSQEEFIESHRKRLRDALRRCGSCSPGSFDCWPRCDAVRARKQSAKGRHQRAGALSDEGWDVSATERRNGATKGVYDAVYLAPDGRRVRSVKAAVALVTGDDAKAPKPRPSDASGHRRAKRQRVDVNYAAVESGALERSAHVDDENDLALALALSMQESGPVPAQQDVNRVGEGRGAGGPNAKAVNINGVAKRKDKLKRHLTFDPDRNKWVKVLSKVRRQVSVLNQKLHFLATFTADASRAGSRRNVAQSQESGACKRQIEHCKKVIRACLQQCENADGDPHIPAECFDANGEVDFEHIQCSACQNPNADDENDILMCDGELCNRAYHVRCLPVFPSFKVDDLCEDDGWLCPACDCRYDILWELAEMFDLHYNDMLRLRWHEVLAEDTLLHDSVAEATGRTTILNASLDSDDDSEDGDFSDGSSSSGEEGGVEEPRRDSSMGGAGTDGAGPSIAEKASTTELGGPAADGKEGDGNTSAPASSSPSSTSGDDDDYESDSDVEGANMSQLLHQLKQESEVDRTGLVVNAKRARRKVDYRQLNMELFGDVECYDGEGVDVDFHMSVADAPASP